jgi:hypothetical protein
MIEATETIWLISIAIWVLTFCLKPRVAIRSYAPQSFLGKIALWASIAPPVATAFLCRFCARPAAEMAYASLPLLAFTWSRFLYVYRSLWFNNTTQPGE